MIGGAATAAAVGVSALGLGTIVTLAASLWSDQQGLAGRAVIATVHRCRLPSVNILMSRSIGAMSGSGCDTSSTPSKSS